MLDAGGDARTSIPLACQCWGCVMHYVMTRACQFLLFLLPSSFFTFLVQDIMTNIKCACNVLAQASLKLLPLSSGYKKRYEPPHQPKFGDFFKIKYNFSMRPSCDIY